MDKPVLQTGNRTQIYQKNQNSKNLVIRALGDRKRSDVTESVMGTSSPIATGDNKHQNFGATHEKIK